MPRAKDKFVAKTKFDESRLFAAFSKNDCSVLPIAIGLSSMSVHFESRLEKTGVFNMTYHRL